MWLSQLLINIGFSAAFPFIPLYLRDHFNIISDAERGFYMSRFYFYGVLAYAIFNPIWGALADRFGVKPMLLRGTFVTAFLYPLMGVMPNVEMLILLRFISGACSGTTAAAQMLMVKTAPDNRQGFSLGVLSTSIWGGSMLGDVVGGLVVYYFGYTATFNLCGILFFIAGLFVILARDARKPERHHVLRHATVPVTPEKRLKHRHSFLPRKMRSLRGTFTPSIRALLILILTLGVVQKLTVPYTALMVELIGGVEKAAYWTGIICAFAAGTSMLSGVLLGILSDRMAAWRLTLPTQFCSSIVLFLQGGSGSLLGFGFCHAANALAIGGIFSVFQRVLSSLTPREKRGTVLGWTSTMYNCGFMISTVISGWIIGHWSTRGVYYTAAVMMFLFAPVSMLIIRRVLEHRARQTAPARKI